MIGISESAWVNGVIVALKVTIVVAGHRARLGLHQPRQLHARSCRRTPASSAHFGWSGVMRAAGMIFFAYIGFDAVSTAAQEAKNAASATCPSASSGRSPSAPFSMCSSRTC